MLQTRGPWVDGVPKDLPLVTYFGVPCGCAFASYSPLPGPRRRNMHTATQAASPRGVAFAVRLDTRQSGVRKDWAGDFN
eukprot:8157953-Pyramimonas_sp.AAC.2